MSFDTSWTSALTDFIHNNMLMIISLIGICYITYWVIINKEKSTILQKFK